MSDLIAVLQHYGCDEPNPDRVTGKIRCPAPDHDERRASCSYDLERGLLNCFSCGFQGDVVNLIMAKENVDVATAIKRREAIAGGGDGAVRGEQERRPSPISGKPGYAPKYRRAVPARARRHFD